MVNGIKFLLMRGVVNGNKFLLMLIIILMRGVVNGIKLPWHLSNKVLL